MGLIDEKSHIANQTIIRSSHKTLGITSSTFEQLREDIISIYETKVSLKKELTKVKIKYYFLFFINALTIMYPQIQTTIFAAYDRMKT